ncbi:RNA polymerase sigma factor [Tolypothrix campylonemoides VB511288_2]|uniref:RNA polymerase sigma-70 region 2 domain-containing protein n=2 Tax=Tolypothrix TaxID=111782 RepID=A0A0C1N1T7_9CYAN
MASPDKFIQKQKFKAAFESLLSIDARFLPVVQRWLKQYGLCHIELHEILGDVYLRGIDAIEKGQIIKNPKAWVRTVARNVIIDKMRNQYKDKKHFNFIELDAIEYIDDIEYEIVSQNLDRDADLDEQILLEKLLKARDELNPEDQMIFDLRFKQDLSWEDVRKHLASSGIHISTATLRKRGERIKERLKQFLLTKD